MLTFVMLAMLALWMGVFLVFFRSARRDSKRDPSERRARGRCLQIRRTQKGEPRHAGSHREALPSHGRGQSLSLTDEGPNLEPATRLVSLICGAADRLRTSYRLPVARERQVAASASHVSQAIPTSVLWRRLELMGATEQLRWLR